MAKRKEADCPFCKKSIAFDAKKCPYCQEWVEEHFLKAAEEKKQSTKNNKYAYFGIAGLFILSTMGWVGLIILIIGISVFLYLNKNKEGPQKLNINQISNLWKISQVDENKAQEIFNSGKKIYLFEKTFIPFLKTPIILENFPGATFKDKVKTIKSVHLKNKEIAFYRNKNIVEGFLSGFAVLIFTFIGFSAFMGVLFSNLDEKVQESKTRQEKEAAREAAAKPPESKVPVKKVEGPQSSPWDGSVYTVVKYLEHNLKDPDSYQSIEWSNVIKTGDSYTVRHKYRAKNSFGGYEIEEQLFTMNKEGNVISVMDFN